MLMKEFKSAHSKMFNKLRNGDGELQRPYENNQDQSNGDGTSSSNNNNNNNNDNEDNNGNKTNHQLASHRPRTGLVTS